MHIEKNRIRPIFILWMMGCLLFCVSILHASTTYYIDSVNGNDSSNGNTDLTPWKTLSKLHDLSLLPGDTILLKCNSVFREELILDGIKGIKSAPVIISSYGTGNKPKLLGSANAGYTGYWSPTTDNLWATPNNSFLKEVNIVYYGTNNNLSPPELGNKLSNTGELRKNWDFCHDGTKSRLIVYHEGGNPAAQGNGIEIGKNVITDSVFLLRKSEYVSIKNIEFRFANNYGFQVLASSRNINLWNCAFYHIYGNSVAYSECISGIINNIYAFNCGLRGKISNVSGENFWIESCDNILIQNCQVDTPHAVGINVWNSTNCIVEKNVVHDMDPFVSNSSHAGIYLDRTDNCIVRYNFVSNCRKGYEVNAETTGSTSSNNRFIYNIAKNNYVNFSADCNQGKIEIYDTKWYNNISFSPNPETQWPHDFYIRNSEGGELKNNIIYGNPDHNVNYESILIENCLNFKSDYNCWYHPLGAVYTVDGTSHSTFNQYRSETGQDTHSINTNPNLSDPKSNNFSLSENSPCIDKGTDVGISQDYADNPVPSGLGVDIGAYEYSCTGCGDLNGDLNITPSDAQRAFDMFLGVITNPSDCDKLSADVNRDASVTPKDAQYIFDRYIGKSALPCETQTASGRMPSSIPKKKAILSVFPLATSFRQKQTATIELPIMIDSKTSLRSFGFDFLFPCEELEFIGFASTELQGLFHMDANQIAEGILRVGGYANTPLYDFFPNELVTLIFRPKGTMQESSAFSIINPVDDLENTSCIIHLGYRR